MTDMDLTTELIDTTETDRRRAYVQGLREMANFLEANLDAPVPYGCAVNVFVQDKAQLASVAKACGGRWEKNANGDYFYVRKTFSGGHAYEVNVSRETVCRKVVTGTRIEPAKPEQEVETYEWICTDPLLAGSAK